MSVKNILIKQDEPLQVMRLFDRFYISDTIWTEIFYSEENTPLLALVWHLFVLKITWNCLKVLNLMSQKTAIYSHFHILLKITKSLGIFSIPVRVTILNSRKQRKSAVSEFLFIRKNFKAAPHRYRGAALI